ncbi:uncharacterized protein LOC123606388 isoform X2 [Leopardus geoffroyi]|uniref:uncharacterized protein LOC123606388 isoform X2 n=1 Tax=Leopardus geoffroyi TaxID=46844 RepID=UPI001E2608C6|nr:uncharacterized protein LOC123606388 isoform X2 [Leopardus geoffroyi]
MMCPLLPRTRRGGGARLRPVTLGRPTLPGGERRAEHQAAPGGAEEFPRETGKKRACPESRRGGIRRAPPVHELGAQPIWPQELPARGAHDQPPHPPPQGQHFTSLSAVCLGSDTAICQMFRGTWPQGKRYLGTRNSEAGPFPRKRETEGKINPGTESRIHVYLCAGSRIRSFRLCQIADRVVSAQAEDLEVTTLSGTMQVVMPVLRPVTSPRPCHHCQRDF